MTFGAWKQEKAKAGLVAEAEAMAERLAGAKPHVVDGYAAAAWFWAVTEAAGGRDLYALSGWPAKDVARFVTAAQNRIATLRKAREYESSDGLAVWLHTARALGEPRIAPAVREIWQMLRDAGPNVEAMLADLLGDAETPQGGRRVPDGFGD